jgi:hypothetical protein
MFSMLIVITGCAPNPRKGPSYPNPSAPTSSPTSDVRISTPIWFTPTPRPPTRTPTATYNPNNIPPEMLFTETPDPYAFTITANLEPGLSKEEITRILFSKWLDHYLSRDVSLEMRLSEYKINKVTIPNNQYCASKLGALFMAEAEVTATTAIQAQAPIGQYSSRWMVSAGGYVSESKTQRTILFRSAISKRQHEYVLKVIMQNPTCD